MRKLTLALGILAMTTGSATAQPGPTLSEAMAGISQASRQAQTCVQVIKTRGDDGQKAAAALEYGATKAAADGLLDGLIAAATQCETVTLPSLRQRMDQLVEKQDALCRRAAVLVPPPDDRRNVVWAMAGQVLGIALGKAVATGIDDITKVIFDARERDRQRCESLRTQLFAQRLPAFEKIEALNE